jgi:hypothetical protein
MDKGVVKRDITQNLYRLQWGEQDEAFSAGGEK